MIAPAPYEFDRGKSIRVRQTVAHLRRLGFELDVLAYPSGTDVDDPSIRIERPSRRFRTDPAVPGLTWRDLASDASMVIKAARALRGRRYAAVHAHDIDGALIAMAARRIARTQVPWVYDMHGAFAELAHHYDLPVPGWLVERVEQAAYDGAAHVILNWPHLREHVATGTPTTLIMDQPDEAVAAALEEPLPLDEPWADDPFILYTGNYAPYQGVDLLLDAFERLDGGTDAEPQLVLTGTPDEAYVREHPRIHYVGFVTERRLAALHQHASVLVSPRLTEGFPPMKILYYLLTDRPIVATDKSCHTAVLSGYDGVYFAEPAPDEFASALKSALAATEPIDRERPVADHAERYQAVYASVLG